MNNLTFYKNIFMQHYYKTHMSFRYYEFMVLNYPIYLHHRKKCYDIEKTIFCTNINIPNIIK